MEAVLDVARREPAWRFAGALGADAREPAVPAETASFRPHPQRSPDGVNSPGPQPPAGTSSH